MRSGKLLVAILALLIGSVALAQKPAPADPQPLAKVSFPTYQTRKLPNGLTVYALEYHEQPVVSVRLVIGAGAVNDPVDLPGVAAMTADLLTEGTKTRSATEIAKTIDQVGASLGSSADMESTIVTAAALTDSVDLAFELMNDIVMNPAFAQEEIDRAKQQAMSGLTASMEDADFVADAVFDRIAYGSHPYGHMAQGTLDSIPKIKREDLAKFHETYYAPNISALAIAGDLKPEDAFKLAERWFGSWKQKDVPKTSLATAKTEARRIVVIDKPDAVQTELRVGQTTVGRKDPDYFNVLVSSYVLGGSAQGRLNQTLRQEKGLTYGAYASIRPRKGPGLFYSVTDTRTEKTGEALQAMLAEIQKIGSTAVPDTELKNAKNFIIGSFPLSIEVPNDLVTRLTTIFLYELGDNYLDTFRDKIAAVSPADVQRVSKDKLTATGASIVAVGNAKEIVKSLEPLGKVEVIPMGDLDLGSPTLKQK
jgi:zinc protease